MTCSDCIHYDLCTQMLGSTINPSECAFYTNNSKLKVATQKLTPQKVGKKHKRLTTHKITYYFCPCCEQPMEYEPHFCLNCGQALDWSEECD